MRAFATGLSLLFATSPAQASSGEGGLFYPVLNFVLLLAVLFVVARKPIQTYFADRRTRIQDEIEAAAELHRDVEQRMSEWQRRLIDLESELEAIRNTARERAQTERAHLLADARQTAERIRNDAATAVDRELLRARERLRDEASELAIEFAAGILRESVTDQDRDRLLDEFIARIEQAPGNAGS